MNSEAGVLCVSCMHGIQFIYENIKMKTSELLCHSETVEYESLSVIFGATRLTVNSKVNFKHWAKNCFFIKLCWELVSSSSLWVMQKAT